MRRRSIIDLTIVKKHDIVIKPAVALPVSLTVDKRVDLPVNNTTVILPVSPSITLPVNTTCYYLFLLFYLFILPVSIYAFYDLFIRYY